MVAGSRVPEGVGNRGNWLMGGSDADRSRVRLRVSVDSGHASTQCTITPAMAKTRPGDVGFQSGEYRIPGDVWRPQCVVTPLPRPSVSLQGAYDSLHFFQQGSQVKIPNSSSGNSPLASQAASYSALSSK